MCTPAPRRPHHGSRNTGQQATHGDTSATGATGKGGRTQHLPGSCLLRKKNGPQLHLFFFEELWFAYLCWKTLLVGELGIPVKSDELKKELCNLLFFGSRRRTCQSNMQSLNDPLASRWHHKHLQQFNHKQNNQRCQGQRWWNLRSFGEWLEPQTTWGSTGATLKRILVPCI